MKQDHHQHDRQVQNIYEIKTAKERVQVREVRCSCGHLHREERRTIERYR